jgi:hypothetical protein
LEGDCLSGGHPSVVIVSDYLLIITTIYLGNETMSSKIPDIPPPTGGSVPQAPPPVSAAPTTPPSATTSAEPEAYSPTWQGGGPARTSHRELIQLPVGFELANGELAREAEVRAVTGADELFIGQSSQYNRHPNDLVYRTLLLSRTVTRIGSHRSVTVADVGKMHALDVRALEYAVYRLTYGEENLPEEEPGPGG